MPSQGPWLHLRRRKMQVLQSAFCAKCSRQYLRHQKLSPSSTNRLRAVPSTIHPRQRQGMHFGQLQQRPRQRLRAMQGWLPLEKRSLMRDRQSWLPLLWLRRQLRAVREGTHAQLQCCLLCPQLHLPINCRKRPFQVPFLRRRLLPQQVLPVREGRRQMHRIHQRRLLKMRWKVLPLQRNLLPLHPRLRAILRQGLHCLQIRLHSQERWMLQVERSRHWTFGPGRPLQLPHRAHRCQAVQVLHQQSLPRLRNRQVLLQLLLRWKLPGLLPDHSERSSGQGMEGLSCRLFPIHRFSCHWRACHFLRLAAGISVRFIHHLILLRVLDRWHQLHQGSKLLHSAFFSVSQHDHHLLHWHLRQSHQDSHLQVPGLACSKDRVLLLRLPPLQKDLQPQISEVPAGDHQF